MPGEAIYKGATRPAMKLGIPLVPLVLLFGTGMLLFAAAGLTHIAKDIPQPPDGAGPMRGNQASTAASTPGATRT